MKKFQKISIIIITVFFVILLSYALISKAGTFGNFRSQLEQAPGIQQFGKILAYSIIILQGLTVFLLCYQRSRLWGLWITFGMVTVFTGYIGFILLDSNNLPCTCIGLFEMMTWKVNLILNIGLKITALAGIITMRAGRLKIKMKRVHPFQSRMPGHSMNFANSEFLFCNTVAKRLTNSNATNMNSLSGKDRIPSFYY